MRPRGLGPILLASTLLAGCYGFTGFNNGRGGNNDDDDAGDDDDAADDDDAEDDDDAADDDDAVDDDDAAPDFRILDLDPDHGTAEGGFNVEVQYEGDLSGLGNDDVTASFGGTPASVLAITDDFVLVEVPPGCRTGDVDLEIDIGGGRSDAEEFEYETYADGLDTAIFTMSKTLNTSVQPLAEWVSVTAKFFEPADAPPGQGMPPLESCTSTLTIPPDTRNYFSVGPGIEFSNGAVQVATTYQPVTGWYEDSGLDGSYFPPNTSWSVNGAVDPNGCLLNLPTVVSAPDDPTLMQPNPFPAPDALDCWTMASQIPGVVQWSAPVTAGPDDAVLIQIANVNTGVYLVCHAADDGAFLVSPSDMLLLEQGLHLATVIRYRPVETTAEPSGATVHGTYSTDMSGLFAVQINPGTYTECL